MRVENPWASYGRDDEQSEVSKSQVRESLARIEAQEAESEDFEFLYKYLEDLSASDSGEFESEAEQVSAVAYGTMRKVGRLASELEAEQSVYVGSFVDVLKLLGKIIAAGVFPIQGRNEPELRKLAKFYKQLDEFWQKVNKLRGHL